MKRTIRSLWPLSTPRFRSLGRIGIERWWVLLAAGLWAATAALAAVRSDPAREPSAQAKTSAPGPDAPPDDPRRSLRGRVVDADGTPVSGATVSAYSPDRDGPWATQTNSDGEFPVRFVTNGNHSTSSSRDRTW